MKRHRWALAVLAVVVSSTGCLVKETTHRIYLSPSGAVAWTVLEEGVRSDDKDLTRRSNEERAWLDAIATDAHPVAEGLRRLGSDDVSTRLLRLERPYMALTDARFARVDRVIARLFEELGLRGEAAFEADGSGATLSISLDPSSFDDAAPDIESPVTALLEDLDRYRFTLTEGHFVAATGFDIVEGGAAATLQEIPEERLKAGEVLKLQLVWRAGLNAGIPLVR
jgi:hypothetical protein